MVVHEKKHQSDADITARLSCCQFHAGTISQKSPV